MQSFLEKGKVSSFDEKVKYAEMKLAGYVAAHNEPFLRMNHLVDVLKDIFPDSVIAQNISLKKTKTKGVVINVLGQDEKEALIAILKANKFSILTDESTDIASVKTSCILVRYYDAARGKIDSRFWHLAQIYEDTDSEAAAQGATASRMFGIITGSFQKHEIPFSNVIGFGSDGCNVMMGANNSVASRMRELCPGISISKCICHSLYLCASEACKCLPRTCEDLARLIFHFFHCSAKRRAQFAEYQAYLGLDILSMLHPSQTRWLSLAPVVDRVLKHWDALRLYFDGQWFEARLESAERIHVSLNDPIVKTYYYFLDFILPHITGMNAYFQSEKPVATFVHDKMKTTYETILLTFMKAEYVLHTPLNDIQPNATQHWKPIEQVYLGVGVEEHLKTKLAMDTAAIDDCLTTCRNFLVTLCLQLKKRYDFANPVLSRLRCFAPDAALSHEKREKTTPSLLTLALLLPRIIDRNDKAKLQSLDDQWRKLPLYAERIPQECKERNIDPETFWHKMNVYEDEAGERPFSDLALFALEAMSIPISNADCERTFSKINDLKNAKRNRLITNTVCGLLHADSTVRASSDCCVSLKPRKTMFAKMTSATIYKFRDNDDGKETADDDGVENLFAGLVDDC